MNSSMPAALNLNLGGDLVVASDQSGGGTAVGADMWELGKSLEHNQLGIRVGGALGVQSGVVCRQAKRVGKRLLRLGAVSRAITKAASPNCRG